MVQSQGIETPYTWGKMLSSIILNEEKFFEPIHMYLYSRLEKLKYEINDYDNWKLFQFMYQHLMNHATGRGHGFSIFLSNSQNEYKVRYTTYIQYTYILCKVEEGLGTM